MKTLAPLLLLVCFTLPPACAQAPPTPPAVVIEFPPTPTPPAPPVGTPTPLTGSALYVVASDTPLLAFASPQALIKITVEEGPISIRGVFVGYGPAVQTKKFVQKHVYLIEAAGTGLTELFVEPAGVTTLSGINRRMLDVTIGPAPPVPPVPPTPPVPPPVPVDPLTQSLKDALTADGQPSSTAAQLASLYRLVASTTAQDPTVKTVSDLFGVVKKAQDSLIDPAKIAKTRAVIGAELSKALGTVPTAPIDRVAAAAVFTKLAGALEGVRK